MTTTAGRARASSEPSEPSESSGSSGPSGREVAAVADSFVALMRCFTKTRARVQAAAEHDVEWSAHMLLRCLHNDGPMRASAVADFLQSDPSTVSRQVASLVKDGLLERRSDPGDGRASLLVLTDRAHAVLADHDQLRLDYFARLLDDWSDADLRQFAGLLGRFTEAYEGAQSSWITERFGARPVRAGSTS